jgi:glycine/D-amino acid oxidase-like deaminating enzyme
LTVDAFTMYEEKSFWTRDWGPYTPNPPLNESIQVDVAVVGGGFLGLNTAREFKKDNPNARVVIVEADVIGWGPSGRNAGFSTTLFGLDPDVTKLLWGTQKATDAARYTIKAVDYTRQIIEENRLDSDYSHPGLLRVAYSEPQVKTLKKTYELYQEFGVAEEMGLHWLSKDELRNEFNSPLFTLGLADNQAGLLHPCKHVRELKRLAMEVNVEIYERTPVQTIERQGNGVLLTLPNVTVTADKVVLATNAYTHLLNGPKAVRRRQFPVWTGVVVTERLSEEQWASVGWANRQGFEDARQLIHYFRPTTDGRIVIGGEDIWAPWGSRRRMDFDYAPRVWQSLESHLKHMFPSLAGVEIAYRWSGPVSFNFDMAPEIGYCGDERIICWTGCFGQGLALTHLNGRLVADLLNDAKTELTDFWIVNRKAIRLPSKTLSFLGTHLMRASMRMMDRLQERKMPA